ncbi:amidohydrolase [Ruthenibacterium lactatiformans]|uniref:amidohydrolase n=1 Tax=Ruthenibacterium lactatiformans TaxID=1550024 RepID=UPI0039A1D8AF
MTDEIVRQTQKLEPLLQQLSSALWQAAEPAGAEDASVRVLTEALRSEGFQIEQGLGCQPTAFRAQYGEGTPRIGFMAEYDALPGLWQERVPHPSGDKARAGHGCGHNLLGAGSTAAAIALARALRAGGRPGTVVLYGTPAEETMLGKNRLLKDGYLKDVDVMLAWHPYTQMRCGGVSHNAMNSILFSFHGRTAHAAADPENGRSALDAAEMMNVGCNYLREHIPEGARLHYSYVHAGEKPNIVPEYAQVWYFVRARTKSVLDDITQRVVRVARGAALMTDTGMEYRFLVKGTIRC